MALLYSVFYLSYDSVPSSPLAAQASLSKLVALVANFSSLSHASFLACGWRFSGYIPGAPASSRAPQVAGPGRFADGGSADLPAELSAYAFDDSEWLPTNVASEDPGEFGGPSGEPCAGGCHWRAPRPAPALHPPTRVAPTLVPAAPPPPLAAVDRPAPLSGFPGLSAAGRCFSNGGK